MSKDIYIQLTDSQSLVSGKAYLTDGITFEPISGTPTLALVKDSDNSDIGGLYKLTVGADAGIVYFTIKTTNFNRVSGYKNLASGSKDYVYTYLDAVHEIETFPPLYLSSDDHSDIQVWWETTGENLTSQVSVDGEAFATGPSLTESSVSVDGYYLYLLPWRASDRPANTGASVYEITDGSVTKYLTVRVGPSLANLSLISPEGVVYLEGSASNIRLKVGSTKAKTHYTTAGNDLTGKTLKLYVDSKPGTPLLELSATGGPAGAFTFTPTSQLTGAVKNYPAALREPSDGNNVLWDALIEVGYAADEAV